MARARNIKPSFFQNDYLVELPFETRLLFIGLWTLADREGRLEYRPKKIKMEIFPADNVDVSNSVKELLDNGFITVYEKNSVKVIQITNFKKHQSPHGTEKDSLLPCEKGLYIVHERRNNLVTGKFSELEVIDNAIVSSHTVKEPLSNVNLQFHNTLNPECGILNPECGILNPECGILNMESHAVAPKTKKIGLKDLIELGVNEQFAQDWIEIRKAKRAPLTKTALDAIIKEAEKAKLSLNYAIRVCVENSWQGFKADWYQNLNQQTNNQRPKLPNQMTEAERKAAHDEMTREAKRMVFGDDDFIDGVASHV